MTMSREAADRKSPNPNMFTVARQARGFTQTGLAASLGTSQGYLSKLESGLAEPTEEILRAVSRVLDYPVEFFFSTEPVYGPTVSELFHRKRADAPARALEKLYAEVNIRRIHVSRLMRAVDLPTNIPRIDPDEYERDVEVVAGRVRAAWQLPPGPVQDVVGVIEDAGGVVVRMPFGTPKVDAMSWWVPGTAPLFFVNEALSADRERLSLCHELAHVVMHKMPHEDMENEANRFAGAFLMPRQDVYADLRFASLHSLAALKPRWRVSIQALLMRAKQLGAIDAHTSTNLWKRLSAAGYRRREPEELDFPKEEPGLLQEMLDLHLGDLGYSPEQTALFLGWNLPELRANYAIGAGATPRLRLIR